MIDIILAFLLGWYLRDKGNENKPSKQQKIQQDEPVGNIDCNGVLFGYMKNNERVKDLT